MLSFNLTVLLFCDLLYIHHSDFSLSLVIDMRQSNICIQVYVMVEVNLIQEFFKTEVFYPTESRPTVFLWGNRY